MATRDGNEVVAPKELILPTIRNVAANTRRHGTIFVSGGELIFVSGSVLIVISGTSIIA
jgi:hypothetical protein